MNKKDLIPLTGVFATLVTAILIYLQFSDGHYFQQKSALNDAEYSYSIITFNKDEIPEYILDYLPDGLMNKKIDVKNNFELNLLSGRSLKDVIITFVSEQEILKIDIDSGEINTNIVLSKNKKIAQLKNPELVHVPIKGSVVTSGVSNVTMSVKSSNGIFVKKEVVATENHVKEKKTLISSLGDLLHSLFSIAIIFALPYLLYKSVTIKELDEYYDNKHLLYLYICLAISSNWGSMLMNIFFAYAIYFMVTKERLVTLLLEKYLNKETF